MKANLTLSILIAERLLAAYELRPAEIARILDEEIDQSGNMLGWLRDYKADKFKSAAAPEETR